MDQPVDEKLVQLDVEPVLPDSGDDTVELISDAFHHKLSLAPIHQLAFGIGGGAFPLA